MVTWHEIGTGIVIIQLGTGTGIVITWLGIETGIGTIITWPDVQFLPIELTWDCLLVRFDYSKKNWKVKSHAPIPGNITSVRGHQKVISYKS